MTSHRARLVVDGYNIIRSNSGYATMMERDPDLARSRLVEDVAAYAANARLMATVVFDGGNNPDSDGAPHHVAGVMVVFSPFGRDADGVIEGLARRWRDRGERVVVATSDGQSQRTVFAPGVTRMSARELAEEMCADRALWREHAPSGGLKSTVASRVSPSVRETLSRLARGR